MAYKKSSGHAYVPWVKGVKRNRDNHTCLHCKGTFERLYPASDRPGFCLECSNNKCKKCGIVLGIWECCRFACGEHHGKISKKDEKICLYCSKRKSKEAILATRKAFNTIRVVFESNRGGLREK